MSDLLIPGELSHRIPLHVGIVMDGNGRWARERGLPRVMGHHAGVKRVEEVVRAAKDMGVRYISLYAFSTENWKRDSGEVSGLMGLFRYYVKLKVKKLKAEGGRLRFAGRIQDLPEDLQRIVEYGERETQDCSAITVVVCLNYGGRQEILDAINRLLSARVEAVDEHVFRNFLYLPDLPDPDLVIRTSGELRISNFWLFQCAYSEFVFSPKYWPDFGAQDLREAVLDYARRDRRYGGVKAQ
ncbi:undecaprenyl diphosphate synthase [Thermanaerovibrio velox DSM 12556]|uniref:Isoprenyl transferase n=1 Tax=Thermanaerovibrio velox DSM 12556 TaxID=926567 RepID=H0URX4_9BACT|nr:polyprenyl diphosphate synthase [Thermanaerovibrio velox]EHM10063.1 undecaprenyl diphosphate synthase [Thermanaerovibrio velox DSM 12556]